MVEAVELEIRIRPATADDIPELLRHRRGMYEAMGHSDPAALARMLSSCEPYFAAALGNGTLRAWLAQSGNHVVAGGAVLISPWPSHPYDSGCRRATILNMYTLPEFRRRGIARRLVQTMIGWCREQGFTHIDLHASDMGRSLYESLGFQTSNEMRLDLRRVR